MRSGECFPLPTPARPIGGNESGSRLTGKESHHVPTPTAQDGISRKSTSSEVLNFDTNKSVSLDRWVGMWPTPNSRDWKDTGDPQKLIEAVENGHQNTLPRAVARSASRMLPTPWASDGSHGGPNQRSSRGDPSLSSIAAKDSRQPTADSNTPPWPTPRTKGMCGGTGNFQQMKNLEERGTITEAERKQMKAGNGGNLNPRWVEWLMGWPIGWTALDAAATEWFRNKPSPRSGGS